MIKVVFFDTNTVSGSKLTEANLPEVPRIDDQILWKDKIYKILSVAWDLEREQVLINLR